MKQNILVIGGTGKTGKRIVNILKKTEHNVRVGSRSAKPSFDWHAPENWASVLEGMDKVYVTFQPDLAVPGAFEAIQRLTAEAQKAQVKKLVLLSGKGEREAQRCEAVIINSGLDYTIIRANWFNQNFSENFLLEPVLQGVVALPFAEAKIPFVDAQDIAEVAVKALTEEGHNGQVYELTGARQLTFKDAVEEISQGTGQQISFVGIDLDTYINTMKDHGMPEDLIWLMGYLFTEVLGNPANSEITNDIEKVLGRKPIDFSDYVRHTVSTGVWNSILIEKDA